MSYADFLDAKAQAGINDGFEPLWIPDFLFPFQQALTEWAIRKGRAALFEDCGLGKTLQELVWAENVVRHTNGRVLILTPLAVGQQFAMEAERFGIEARRSRAGELHPGINITNYERLHLYNRDDFVGVVCDESSILKNFDGATRGAVTEFMRKMRYRLLATATAAPNDYIELGTSSEALGELGYTDMLTRFFKNDQGNAIKTMVFRQGNRDFRKLDDAAKWRFKGHAEIPFWQWVCSWARAVRRPSDLGFEDGAFILPPLIEQDHLVDAKTTAPGMLFSLPAVGLAEQREERRRTITERCEKAAQLVTHGDPALIWCHMNDEGDLLEKLIPDCVQVSGKDSDDAKENKLMAFAKGQVKKLITKPKIGAWGLNFQHCGHVTSFPSHSFEQYYQGVRRCWRFGRKGPVTVDVITTEGEKSVLKNLQRKAAAADVMFSQLVAQMNDTLRIQRSVKFSTQEEVPAWL